MEIKLTLKEADPALEGINRLAKIKLGNLALTMQVSKLQRKLRAEVGDYIDARNDLIKELGEEKEDGSVQLLPENVAKFNKKIEAVLGGEVVLDRVKRIDTKDLEGIEDELDAEILTLIYPLMVDEDAEPEKPNKANKAAV